MKISLDWLKQYIAIDADAKELDDKLTFSGLEVEGIEPFESIKGGLKDFVIGEIKSCEQHPDADKLKVTKVDIGEAELAQIVCGADNVAIGQKVVVAKVGATIHPPEGNAFQIKKAKLRGVASEGMICAEDEIGVGSSHAGIMVLDTDLPNGSPAADYFQVVSDQVFEIGLTPNRADAASHIGVARDLKALYQQEINWPSVNAFQVKNTARRFQITVADHMACPRYSGLTISNVTVKESPSWLKNRLQSIGLEPINNVVDITNFVLHEIGQPLHAFDADKLSGDHIQVKKLPENTKFTTLDNKERKLSAHDLMICDGANNPLCIAGVFGGKHSGVSESTKNIFLESAYFAADSVRKTSQFHGLKTDASFRYERGTDPNITVWALKRAALLIEQLTGGQVSSEIVDIYPNPIADFEVNIRFKNIDRLIGKKLPKVEIFKILNALDINVQEENEEGFKAIVPPYRVDVTREADVVEEILRIHGINQIELSEHLGADFLSDFPQVDTEKYQQVISSMLADNGFYEIITNSLTNAAHLPPSEELNADEHVVILNKLSEELGVMRQSMMSTGLPSVAHNLNHKKTDIKFFEFGKVYKKKEASYQENKHLAIYLSGRREAANAYRKEEFVNFNELYAIIQKIFNKLIPEITDKEEFYDESFNYGLKYTLSGQLLVKAGSLSKQVLKQHGIKQEVFYAELNWDLLMQNVHLERKYQAISKYPEVQRDLSLVVDQQVSYQDIKKIAGKYASQLLKDVELFDIYLGDKIAEGKKAYAITFVLQDDHKTLTDKVIDKQMNRLMKAYESEIGAIIRK